MDRGPFSTSRPETKHGDLTAQIITQEIELNDKVYALFDLTPEETRIIEESTKYQYVQV